ncbi:MAG: hypothetical protein AAGA30_00245 [Planctomycetota bacterium]
MDHQPKEVKVKYQERAIREATHFVLSASEQRLLVECVTGRPENDDPCIEVNTRIAMSWDSAVRLSQSLDSIIQNQRARQLGSHTVNSPRRQASLLSLSNGHDAKVEPVTR